MDNLKPSIASQIRTAKTPAEELRTTLGQLEARIGKIGFGKSADPIELLEHLDHANALLEQLGADGGNLSGEYARFDTLVQQYRRKGKRFLKDAGGRNAFRQLRAARAEVPPETSWWWYIDEVLDAEQRTRRARSLRSLGIAAASLIVLSAIYMLFLRPDEATRMRHRYSQDAEQALMANDPATALVATEQALTYAPDDGELLTMRGVELTLLDRQTEAEAAFSRASEAFEDEAAFYAARAQGYMIGNRPDLALLDSQRLIEIDENDAFAHFQMGNANASLGNFYEATANYEKAGELARAAGELELEGMARVQLANLMMIMMSPQMDTVTPPTPNP